MTRAPRGEGHRASRAPPPGAGSLLDRLLGPGHDRAPASELGALRDGLRRDLEALLNTRRRFLSWPDDLAELDRSLLAYGLADFSHESTGSHSFGERFVLHVEETLRRFEPRLQAFDVQLLGNADALDRTLRFRITGAVVLGRERQDLRFDSFVDPVEGAVVVRG